MMEYQHWTAEDIHTLFAIWSEAQIQHDLEGAVRSGRLIPLFSEQIWARLPVDIQYI